MASRGRPKARKRARSGTAPVRYAVIGLGHIAQMAVLPAFASARNSRLCALVSGDDVKLATLARRYRVPGFTYAQASDLFASGDIDAVYVALPNSMHAEWAERACQAGLHVLCEKPLAVTEEECERVLEAARNAAVKLMVAYRLHFERSNLRVIQMVRQGRIGEPRFFESIFSMQIKRDDIRLQADLGGGPLYDIGIYCINAARSIFADEPEEVVARSASTRGDQRFDTVDEMTSVILRFPKDRLATFTCSFGADDYEHYRVVGTRGRIEMVEAYSYRKPIEQTVVVNGRQRRHTYARRDQFAAEISYFSDCIVTDREPEPSAIEGLADVRIVRAALQSATAGKGIRLDGLERRRRPTLAQEIHHFPVRPPVEVRVQSPRADA